MSPAVAFLLYITVGSVVVFMFLLLCVRVSVYIEDTCPTGFCLRRQQRRMRKILVRRVLDPDGPNSPRLAPPSDENITSDIICQPYIYRDAYSTGLTGISTLANLPIALTYTGSDVGPGDAVVINPNSNRIARYLLPVVRGPVSSTPPRALPQAPQRAVSPAAGQIEITMNSDDDENARDEVESLPPDYLNAYDDSFTIDSKSITTEDFHPPPSYYECVKDAQMGTNPGT